jgi:hypothetical protein
VQNDGIRQGGEKPTAKLNKEDLAIVKLKKEDWTIAKLQEDFNGYRRRKRRRLQ